jgi:hypothetical protein
VQFLTFFPHLNRIIISSVHGLTVLWKELWKSTKLLKR